MFLVHLDHSFPSLSNALSGDGSPALQLPPPRESPEALTCSLLPWISRRLGWNPQFTNSQRSAILQNLTWGRKILDLSVQLPI